MSNKMATGSGASMHWLDREEKRVKVDFSGYDGEMCFRNDASILFFASNSYRSAFLSLGRDLENRFENNAEKDIEHLILPYLFNFRHFVELELKALYVAMTNESPFVSHDLKSLSDKTEKALNNITYKSIDRISRNVSEEEFNNFKNEAISIFSDLKRMILQYCLTEVAVEYYRYIFEKDGNNISLKNPVIEFDFKHQNELFINIRDKIDKLRMKLREFIYIYCTV